MKNKGYIFLIVMSISCKDSQQNKNSESIYLDTAYTYTTDTTSDFNATVVDTSQYSEKKLTKEEEIRRNKILDDFFGPEFYKIGAKPSVVIKVEGQPSRVSVVGPYKTFYYGVNSLTFYNNRLESYDNYDGKLKIKIQE